jgi:sporulation protein YlmC with PRC-barrel domain
MTTIDVTRDNFGMYANSSEGPGPAPMGANTLLGNDVYNRDGQDLGDIKEFMIDMASGKIAYAVLSFGGLLGLGDKLFAVPWAALTLDTAMLNRPGIVAACWCESNRHGPTGPHSGDHLCLLSR